MTVPAVEVSGLRKTYRVRSGGTHTDFVAVDDMTFTIPTGGSLAIVGESGSGKTTTARMLIGQEPSTAGTIRLCGEDWSGVHRSSRARRRRGGLLQIVFQDPYTSLDPRQTIGSSIAEVLRLHTTLDRPRRRARVTELIDSVGLDERHLDVRPSALSGGQRQRVAIAKALAASPSVLVLDEAVSALDVSIQAQVLNLLADIRRATGVAYLFISHDLAVVRQISDEVLVLQRGRTVEHGTTAQVLDHPGHPYTQRLLDSVPRRGWRPVRSSRS
jgi:ABC-type glutathione transport system ATPase component